MPRPRSIQKSEYCAAAFALHDTGMGVRRIVRELESLGCWTTYGSVFRLLKGLPPYQNAELGESYETPAT